MLVLSKDKLMQDIIQKAKQIRLVIFDVDGVLTDGRLFFDQNGIEYKSFNAKDGQGLKLLMQSGVQVAIISGRKSEAVKIRMKNLGIQHVYQGHENKIASFESLCKNLGIKPEQVAHVGDDLPDLAIMTRAGLAIAVQDAHQEVIKRADWQTQLAGGKGAAREVCDFVMEAQGTLSAAIQEFLQ